MAGRKARCKCGAVLQLPLVMTRAPKRPEGMDLSALEEAAALASGSQAYDFANEPATPKATAAPRAATVARPRTAYSGYTVPRKQSQPGFWGRPVVAGGGVGSGFVIILLIRIAIRSIIIATHTHPQQQVDNTPAINIPDPPAQQQPQPQLLDPSVKPAEPLVPTFHYQPPPPPQFQTPVMPVIPQYVPPAYTPPPVPRPTPQPQAHFTPAPVVHPRRQITGNPSLLIHAQPGDLLGNEVPADVMGARNYAIRGPRKFSSLFSNDKSRGWTLPKVDGVPGYFEVAVIQKPGNDVPIATSADSNFGVMQNGILQAGGAELGEDWIDGIDFKRAEGKVTRFTHPAESTLWLGRDGMYLIIMKAETAPGDSDSHELLVAVAESLRHLH
jgi:hypothetical protein